VTGSVDAGFLAGLCDDAAVFPPGSLPLAEAVLAHGRHRRARYADVVGAFVLASDDLGPLADLTSDLPEGSLPLSVIAPVPRLGEACVLARTIPAVRLAGLEVAVPTDMPADAVVPAIAEQLGCRAAARVPEVRVFVEVPRDERRPRLIRALAASPYAAKLRTGGVRADLYPDERELAEAVVALVAAGVPFKGTAGLHHALRNTDPETGFEQHGFLNLLVAVSAACDGADVAEIVPLLATRDPETVVAGVRQLGPQARDAFGSFGTCSIAEPVDELVDLGLLPTDHRTTAPTDVSA